VLIVTSKDGKRITVLCKRHADTDSYEAWVSYDKDTTIRHLPIMDWGKGQTFMMFVTQCGGTVRFVSDAEMPRNSPETGLHATETGEGWEG
jgi:hypothetical protein